MSRRTTFITTLLITFILVSGISILLTGCDSDKQDVVTVQAETKKPTPEIELIYSDSDISIYEETNTEIFYMAINKKYSTNLAASLIPMVNKDGKPLTQSDIDKIKGEKR